MNLEKTHYLLNSLYLDSASKIPQQPGVNRRPYANRPGFCNTSSKEGWQKMSCHLNALADSYCNAYVLSKTVSMPSNSFFKGGSTANGTSITSTMGYRKVTTMSATTTAATLSGVTASTETTNQGKNYNFSQFFMMFFGAMKMTLNAPDGGLTL